MKKSPNKKNKSKKIILMFSEYILAIACLLLIFFLLNDHIDSNTFLDEEGIRWRYSIVNGCAQDVCYYSGRLKETVKIPENINVYPVISLKGANKNQNLFGSNINNTVKEIVIPGTVQEIKEDTFKNCVALKQIKVPDSVLNIGERAYEGCSNLESVKLSSNITVISASLFNNCINLVEIDIPENVLNIEKEAFQNCYLLKKVNLPDSLQTIGDNSFSNCYELKEINLPRSLTLLGEGTFAYCKSLKQITIPKDIERIGYNEFLSCDSLEEVNINSGLVSIGNDAFNGCTKLKEIKIPNTVMAIGMEAFMNCSILEKIILPTDIVGVEIRTFYNCTNLKTVNFGKALEKIEAQAFTDCKSLDNVTIPEKVKDIGEYAFFGCDSLNNLNINNNNESYIIQDGIIYNKNKTELVSCICNGSTEISVPEDVIKIKTGAFRGNRYIQKIYLGQNVQEIEAFSFAECTNLADIYLDKEREYVTFSAGWDLGTYEYLHDINCVHKIEQESQNETEEIITEIKCMEDHTFKVTGNIQNMKVRLISDGDFTDSEMISEIIQPNKNGVYKIENVNRDKKIILQNREDAGGVVVKYLDTDNNEISEQEYIKGRIGEQYHTNAKNIDGYGRIENDSIPKDGTLSNDLITVTYTYQKINRNEINLFAKQDVLFYIIIILATILVNLIIFVIKDRKR